jgi:transcriptional regulator with XRE-family HTH domain
MSPGVGAALRAAREAQGLQQAEAAAALSQPAEVLAALESERFDALGGQMRVKALLRVYGRYLGLDTEQLLARFETTETRGPGRPASPPRSQPAPGEQPPAAPNAQPTASAAPGPQQREQATEPGRQQASSASPTPGRSHRRERRRRAGDRGRRRSAGTTLFGSVVVLAAVGLGVWALGGGFFGSDDVRLTGPAGDESAADAVGAAPSPTEASPAADRPPGASATDETEAGAAAVPSPTRAEPSPSEPSPARTAAASPTPSVLDTARPPEQTSVQILAKPGASAEAEQAGARLDDLGYYVVVTNQLQLPYDKTTVLYTDGYQAEAKALKAREVRIKTVEPNTGFSDEVFLHLVVTQDWSS